MTGTDFDQAEKSLEREIVDGTAANTMNTTATTSKIAPDGVPLQLPDERRPKRSARFWMVIVALSVLAFISSLDTMITGTALPTITAQLDGSSVYIWIANCFVFACSAVIPLVGQLADILGRKTPSLGCVVLFAVGSGVAGGATNAGMFIAGRVVQGLGAGGIYVLIDIIVCDLVPLRDRGAWLGIVNAWAGVAAALGPVLGGVLGERDWRWIFYLNIPFCVIAFFTILFFMHVKSGGPAKRITSLDVVGNLIFVPSITSLLIGLVTGGILHPWTSFRVILPIVLGIAGWICFHLHQHFIASNPGVPSHLFANRTSAGAYILAFLSSVLLQTAGYFLPVYFQAVQGTTVFDSGVYFLPLAIGTLTFAAVGGILMSRLGIYRPIHAAAFAFSALGFGLFTLLKSDTPKVAWAWYQLILVLGLGPTISTVLPAILVGLSANDVAAATAVFTFVKTFGFVWGVTIPSIIFNGVFNRELSQVSDAGLRAQLADGGGYAFASLANGLQSTVNATVWAEVLNVYVRSLNPVWYFGLGLSLFAMFCVAVEDHLPLSTELETEYGLQDTGPLVMVKEKDNDTSAVALESGSAI
jgi:EmrB/QacA subfamily drug resistance transporter